MLIALMLPHILCYNKKVLVFIPVDTSLWSLLPGELQRTYLSGDRAVLISLTVKVKVHLICLSVCILMCTPMTL